jgi:Fe-S oxidoreductase
MNPGKVVNPPRMDDAALLRYGPDYHVIPVNTRYDWTNDLGLSGAVEMCNGAGVCRKEDTGTMCPSYMATHDEAHSTRGRANALRSAMTGDLPDGMGAKALHEVFDLCLSCKACSAECPSSVDVAKMKAEFLTGYHDIHGIPLKTRLFGNIHRVNKLASLMPTISNISLENPFTQAVMQMAGIPIDRPLPSYAAKRFSQQASADVVQPAATLIIDTFTEYNHPEIGLAVVKVAHALGVPLNLMRLPNQGCCGRPAMSKGLLDTAKNMANDNVWHLRDALEGAPFIFLEPSCQSAFTDDYLTLVDKHLQDDAKRIAENCQSVEQWLGEQLAAHTESLNWDNHTREILLHGHCHQKALWGTQTTKFMLSQIPKSTVTEIDSGCCGVAGSFGYEHYDLSMKIANQRLLPAIEAQPEAVVVAPGTSCRAQISDAGHTVWHPVEVVAQALGLS